MKKLVTKTVVCFAALFALLSVLRISGGVLSENVEENANPAIYLCSDECAEDDHKM